MAKRLAEFRKPGLSGFRANDFYNDCATELAEAMSLEFFGTTQEREQSAFLKRLDDIVPYAPSEEATDA